MLPHTLFIIPSHFPPFNPSHIIPTSSIWDSYSFPPCCQRVTANIQLLRWHCDTHTLHRRLSVVRLRGLSPSKARLHHYHFTAHLITFLFRIPTTRTCPIPSIPLFFWENTNMQIRQWCRGRGAAFARLSEWVNPHVLDDADLRIPLQTHERRMGLGWGLTKNCLSLHLCSRTRECARLSFLFLVS